MARRPEGKLPQLRYSEIQGKTHDIERRVQKAAKIAAVLEHFLGTSEWQGLRALDIGCSTGFTAEAIASRGASVMGIDIDQPGVASAHERAGDKAVFACADGTSIPLGTGSIDIVVFNHIYEHVIDPHAVLSEIRRVLRPNGVVYLGLGNKYSLIEPHYRLPLLSWLPRGLAHKYVRITGRADSYYEEFFSRSQLRRMCAPLRLWDYSSSIVFDPRAFNATDAVPAVAQRLPTSVEGIGRTLSPTFIWIGTPGSRSPAGDRLRVSPVLLDG